MKCTLVSLAAALLAGGTMIVWLPNCGSTQEQRTAAKEPTAVTAAEPTLRIGKEAIEKSFDDMTSIDFNDVSLQDVLNHLKQKHRIEVQFDHSALRDAAIDPSTTQVSLKLKDVSLGSALKLILSQFNLTTLIKDEVLLVTTTDKANNELTTVVYDVRDLLLGVGNGQPDYDSLIKLITSTIAAPTWQDTGGPGTVQGIFETLAISQSADTHEQIADLLAQLRYAKEAIKAGKFAAPIDIGAAVPAEVAIKKALAAKVDLDFNDKSLLMVGAFLRNQHNIEIQFDKSGLADAALDPSDTQVSYNANGVTLRSALNGILGQFNLTWVIKDEVLMITTTDKANNELITQLYPIGDVLTSAAKTDDASAATSAADRAQELANCIVTTAAAPTWSQGGGPATMGHYFQDNQTTLVISQTRDVHDQIADLLAQFRRVQRKQQEQAAAQPARPAEPEVAALRVYELRVSAPNAPAMTPQEVAEVVKGLVEPKSWAQPDVYIRGVTGKLVVRQLPSVQREVEKLLNQLGAAAPTAPGGTGKGGGFF